MRMLAILAIVVGSTSVVSAYPTQPHEQMKHAFVDQRQTVPARSFDGTGYYGQGSISGGPVGGLPNRN